MNQLLPQSIEKIMVQYLSPGEKVLKTEKVKYQGQYFYIITFGKKKLFLSSTPTGEYVLTETGDMTDKQTAAQIVTGVACFEELFSGPRLEQLKRAVKSGEDRSLVPAVRMALEETYEAAKKMQLIDSRVEEAYQNVLTMAHYDVIAEEKIYAYDRELLNRYQRVQQPSYFDLDIMLELLEKKLSRDEVKLAMIAHTLDAEEDRRTLLGFFKRRDVLSSLGKQQQKNIQKICSSLIATQSEDETNKRYVKKEIIDGKEKHRITFNVRKTFLHKMEKRRLPLLKNR